MKYTGNTVSKPVVGTEARILSKAMNSGGYVANAAALATARKIAGQILKERKN